VLKAGFGNYFFQSKSISLVRGDSPLLFFYSYNDIGAFFPKTFLPKGNMRHDAAASPGSLENHDSTSKRILTLAPW
jgi:hypothetical protein